MPTQPPRPQVAVGAVVIEMRRDGPYVLLVRRAQPPGAGKWSLPGGKVEPGETLQSAVAREVLEETGIAVQVGNLVEVVEVIDADYHYVILDYACEPTGGTLKATSDAAAAELVPVFDMANYHVDQTVRRVVSRAIADERE